MRITNNMMVNNLLRNVNRNLSRMDGLNTKMSTGRKFSAPSDDPIGVSRSLRLHTDVSIMDQYKRNVDDADSWITTTEIATANMITVLQRARELTVQATNDVYTVEQRANVAKEIEELKKELISIGNTSYAGSYIFSGFKTDKALFDTATETYNVGGGTNTLSLNESIEFDVGMKNKIGVNILGQRLFGLADGAGDLDLTVEESLTSRQCMESKDIYGTITLAAAETFTINYDGGSYAVNVGAGATDINQIVTAINTALTPVSANVGAQIQGNRIVIRAYDSTKANNDFTISGASGFFQSLGFTDGQKSVSEVKPGDKPQMIAVFDQLVYDMENGITNGIESALSRFDKMLNNVITVRSELGVKTNRIELTTNRILDDSINLNKLMAKNEDVDMAETIMNLKNEENVYKASLSCGARIIQPSLIDFLR